MICLDNTDVIEGGASVDAVIDYTFHGLVGTAFTQLAAGVMNTTLTAVLYTAGAAMSVVSIILVNKHTSAVDITLCLDPANGGNPRYLIPKTISLGAGYSLHTDGARLTIIDGSGGIVAGLNISDTAYGAGWNGVTTVAPSKNAVYDEMELRAKAAAVIADNQLIRGDGGARGVQESTIIVDDSGRMINPSQPCFHSKVNASQSNCTGDGTIFSITGAFWTDRFDQGNDFSNGTFTAPVTSRYLLTGTIDLASTDGDRMIVRLVTSNRTYYTLSVDPTKITTNNEPILTIAMVVDMDISDTAYLSVQVSNGTLIATLQVETLFTGALVC